MQEIAKLMRDKEALLEYSKAITKTNCAEEMEKIYAYLRAHAENYYSGKKMKQAFLFLLEDLFCIESKYLLGQLIEPQIQFDLEFKSENPLKMAVFEVRKYLYGVHTFGKYNVNPNQINLTNDCQTSALKVQEIFNQKKIKCETMIIFPGYSSVYNLYNGSGFHYFNIVTFENKRYLVDITYSQFFAASSNHYGRIGIPCVSGADVGLFMKRDEFSQAVATAILKDGYIELNSEVFKAYLDGFTLSFRNGLYYENTGDYLPQVSYNISDYLKFFRGEDNQVNHEGLENLGFQKRPLKNPNLPLKINTSVKN